MSESNNTLTLVAYVITIIPSIYFLYRIVREVLYMIFKKDDEDLLH